MIRTHGKALLLRVGIDRGTGGALGPLFLDGTFEYIPIPERKRTRHRRTYATLPGRHGAPLAAYLPRKLADVHPHVDPDFETATYGDAAPRKCRQLSKLAPGDILVFYCGLAPYPPDDIPRLFVIGYLGVKKIHRIAACDDKAHQALQHRFGNTAHFLRCARDRELVLVEGQRCQSQLLRRALPLGDSRDDLLRDLARLGYQGSVRRAVGHWIRDATAMKFVEGWLKNGIKMLVEGRSRLFLLPSSAVLRATGRRGDVNVAMPHDRPAGGDWVLVVTEEKLARILLFARVNHCKITGGRCRAHASLFWHFSQGGPCIRKALPELGSLRRLKTRTVGHQAIIRRLVFWFSQHYRIGLIQAH